MNPSKDEESWVPDDCHMPDLSYLNSKVILTLMLNRAFVGGGPSDPKSNALVTNFVRISDKVVSEYESTRLELRKFVETPNNVLSTLLIATGHCEMMITCFVRAVRLGRSIRRDQLGPNIDRGTPILKDSIYSRVKDLRNAIEHVDSQIANDTWVEGKPVCLRLYKNKMELSGLEIRFDEFAKWVVDLNIISEELAEYSEKKSI